ncbi:hypothetical protein [Jeotgalibacillus haloalkalitolerans]|uniref:Uncharacterized protein n=1 Tax=Jeotgalibacillus haloalkalitolerans TaxID=3104292 RepID=A0ABU5KKZ5_9BACL|nr:hypothetical protein [Jeotgalibacillus sp. HH7-29]MDZ5711935.1 hypothetical protein [Jeotgalibacillus sp. HH7-29]
MTDRALILQLYSSLWNNRSFETIEHMKSSIVSELSDENTHPRLRRSPETKLQITIQMIRQSDLNSGHQEILINYVKDLFEQNFNK